MKGIEISNASPLMIRPNSRVRQGRVPGKDLFNCLARFRGEIGLGDQTHDPMAFIDQEKHVATVNRLNTKNVETKVAIKGAGEVGMELLYADEDGLSRSERIIVGRQRAGHLIATGLIFRSLPRKEYSRLGSAGHIVATVRRSLIIYSFFSGFLVILWRSDVTIHTASAPMPSPIEKPRPIRA